MRQNRAQINSFLENQTVCVNSLLQSDSDFDRSDALIIYLFVLLNQTVCVDSLFPVNYAVTQTEQMHYFFVENQTACVDISLTFGQKLRQNRWTTFVL